jgi:hypothetical protein
MSRWIVVVAVQTFASRMNAHGIGDSVAGAVQVTSWLVTPNYGQARPARGQAASGPVPLERGAGRARGPLAELDRSGSAAVSGHGLVTDATDWALRNVTHRNFTDVFPQVSGLGTTERHHSAWWSCNIKWKPGNEPEYF